MECAEPFDSGSAAIGGVSKSPTAHIEVIVSELFNKENFPKVIKIACYGGSEDYEVSFREYANP